MFFISSYSSTSLVFLPEPSQPMADSNNFFDDESEGIFKDENFESLVNKLHVSGIAMVTLGGGLLGQALLATWAYCAVSVPTWSSSPIDTALACQQRGIKKLEGHTMLSVTEGSLACPSRDPQGLCGSLGSLALWHSLDCRRGGWHSSQGPVQQLQILWCVRGDELGVDRGCWKPYAIRVDSQHHIISRPN
jgi:hypothetical protein